MTYPNSQFLNTVSSGGTSTTPFLTIFDTRSPTQYDKNYKIQQRWINTSDPQNPVEWILIGFTITAGVVLADWRQLGSNAFDLQTITGNSGVATVAANNLNILGASNITTSGSGSTLSLSVSGTTNHAVQVGNAGGSLSSVGPGTLGAVFIGGSGDPSFSTIFSVKESSGQVILTSSSGSFTPTILAQSTSGSQFAAIQATANSTKTGFFASGQGDPSSGKYWCFGMESINSNQFSIVYNSSGVPAPDSGTLKCLSIATAGTVTIPGGDLVVTRTVNAGGPQMTLINPSTTVGATVRHTMQTSANGATSDAYTLAIAGTASNQAWEYGVLGSDKSFVFEANPTNAVPQMDGTIRLRISQSGALKINEAYTMPTTDGTSGQQLTTDGAGVVSWSSSGVASAAFQFYLNTATASNLTGDGTSYTLGTDALTQLFQTGSGMATNGNFTAPVTGVYYFYVSALLTNLSATHTQGQINITAPSIINAAQDCNPGIARTSSGGDNNHFTLQGSTILSLSAGAVVNFTIVVSGGTKTVGLYGDGTTSKWTYITGMLVS